MGEERRGGGVRLPAEREEINTSMCDPCQERSRPNATEETQAVKVR